MMYTRNRSNGGVGLIIALVFFFLFFSTLFYSLRWIFQILSTVGPFLFIATLFINFDIVKDYVNMVLNKLKENPGIGILYAVGSVVLFPFLSAFLFYKAITEDKDSRKKRRASKKQNKKREEEYIPFEEIIEESPLDFEKMREERKTFEEVMEERKNANN